jgi:hypothetical protein
MAVVAGDGQVDFDMTASRPILGTDLLPMLARDPHHGAADVLGQPVLLGLAHHRLRFGHRSPTAVPTALADLTGIVRSLCAIGADPGCVATPRAHSRTSLVDWMSQETADQDEVTTR